MTTFLLILMTLLLIAALERTNRRQSPRPPSLNGSFDHNDRDWARKLKGLESRIRVCTLSDYA